MSSVADSALGEFLAECEEICQRVSANLACLEKGDFSSDTVDSLYRDMHTMKGTSQLFGYKDIGAVAHAMEASLEPLRRLGCAANGHVLDALFKNLGLVDRMVQAVGKGESQNFEQEVNHLVPLLIEASTDYFSGLGVPTRDDAQLDELTRQGLLGKTESVADPQEVVSEPPAPQPQPEIQPQAQEPAPPPVQVAPEPKPEESPVSEKTAPEPKPEPPQVQSAPTSSEPPKAVSKTAAAADSTIRVQVNLLDKLMNLVGEMVLVRNQVLQFANQSEDLDFLNLSQKLDIVTSDLQGEVMKTRMQPIGSVLNKFQRVVRDLAKDLGKKIDLTLEGTETELDKTLLEAIKDPLTHIIRNACDHGVETPADRKASGKNETGRVHVRAFHEGGQVIVEIVDDGKGIPREGVLNKAIEKGLVSPEMGARMTDREVYHLIFHPGFSTAQQVSNISGRGVGMDVVKTNIEKIGGTVDVDSRPNAGSTMRLKIPLTLAIVPAMIVRSAEHRYAIPQVKLVELVRVENGDADQVEYVQGQPVYRLRGELLPLVDLNPMLYGAENQTDISEGANIVVLNADGSYFGMIVDEILDTADIVVKPLSKFLKELNAFSGATIMGDGAVALILDVLGLAEKLNFQTQTAEDSGLNLASSETAKGYVDSQEFLLFELNTSSTYAVPLCIVNRLEEFEYSQVEFSGEQQVVRYRDGILPLVDLNEYLGFEAKPTEQASDEGDVSKIHAIVIHKSNRAFGVVVNSILDVVTIDDDIDDSFRDRRGVMGNLVHDGEVIVCADMMMVISDMILKLGGAVKAEEEEATPVQASAPKKVLLAEDTAFFRRHVTKFLEGQNFVVTAAKDGKEALDILLGSNPGDFDFIVSDIEMPNLDGFGFAREARAKGWKLPMIALTTRFKQRDIDEGREAGFTLYLEKLNEEELTKGIDQVLKGA